MSNIAKPKFHVFDINGQNYQSWRLDVELHLQQEGLAESLKKNGKANDKDKANTLIFICRHLHESLKVKYLMVREPLKLWNNLKEKYDHMKIVVFL